MSEKSIADVLSSLVDESKEAFLLHMKTGEALGKALKFKSKKTVERTFDYEYAKVARALAISLGSLNPQFGVVFDTPTGAVIETRLPKDFFSLGGTVMLQLVEEDPSRVKIIGTSEIKGQLFDWGKGKRALNDIFDKTEQFLQMLSA
jgi:hypothetical protein